ncbi:hypothetical protein MIMGU_mgv1a021864mg [Erythranthe guttata]|uniref:Uncharacterized protein n=1 Tax=Erythranthe guttata TaxID=4155 RepID=A0A022R7R3_ERYGU|nr:hypothetical protein MIMGU_mgv1a021864mg [Erythranthe guttata]
MWFQLCHEEAFYLFTVMKCIKIVGQNSCVKKEEELWDYMSSKRVNFPVLYKAYSHLRTKNWVVRAGSQYGVDFHSTLNLCGSVAKTLLVLHISRNCNDFDGASSSPWNINYYSVEERIVARWNREQSRENCTVVEKESCKSS